MDKLGSRKLRDLAQTSFNCLSNAAMNVDIHPLSKQGEFDDHIPFVKRLTIIELLRIALFGDTITGYDLGSMRLTIPHGLLAPVWKLRNSTVRVRRYLYWKYVARRHNLV